MKVKDIQIDGFGVWTGLSVDSLSDGMTLFYGPNEAGKTTLMQFLRAMFYGFTPDRRRRYLPPIHGGLPGGAVRVTGPGGGYEIRRRAQLTDENSGGQLSISGSDGLTQGQHRLSMLMGQIDEAIFTNVFAIGLRELQELNTLDDTSAADELYKLSSGLDRVSLVDCMRSLRGARQTLIGKPDLDRAESNRLMGLMRKQDQLRDEIEDLTRRGRRWSELAGQRLTQQQEIRQIAERTLEWESEARTVEVAVSVRETWLERIDLTEKLTRMSANTELPEDAPSQLVQLDAHLEDRKQKLEDIKRKRRELRDKADSLPLSRRMLDLQPRIEAANQQGTWIEALQEQIQRLDTQITKSQQQVDSDAEKLGIDEYMTAETFDGRGSQLPDFSRQTLSALSEPAKAVKGHGFRLKQAREEGVRDKAEAERLGAKLKETLDHAHASNIQDAMKQQGENIALIRRCIQTEEHLEKLKRHYHDLEKESLDLATDEALPIDRTLFLTGPFVFGGVCLIYGFMHLFRIESFVSSPSSQTGMISVLIGILSLGLWYVSREHGDRGTSRDLEDCERQIDSLRRQLREVESEFDELQRALPAGNGSLESRLRDTEELLARLEGVLPTYHRHLAATQRYKSSCERAQDAADALKGARNRWQQTLEGLGLSQSMSPSHVRKLSEGYETFLESQRRVEQLKSERAERQRELASIAKRIETLYLEAVGPEATAENPGDSASLSTSYEEVDSPNGRKDRYVEARSEIQTTSLRKDPLGQLNHLNEELSRQQHWIKRRRELIEQDNQYKKQQGSIGRAAERLEQNRRSIWAKCGVATAEQFYELVDCQTRRIEVQKQLTELDEQIRKIIGSHAAYDSVIAELDGGKLSDLEKRFDGLTERISQAQDRADGLRTRQGELAQEMKQLAEDGRLASAQLEIGCIERQIESMARRWQTLAMASTLLEDVCTTVEKERQPETLREASSFLMQLTDGKYTRIWTPLGTNRLNIDSRKGKALPLEVLSRGTREAVFIALRLSLAAAYARRGVMLPLVLDDVLVNFDRDRAVHAAKTLQTFSQLGHQVLMFTCHQHIADIFHEIGSQVRLLPQQGKPGHATILEPPQKVVVPEVLPAKPVAVEPVPVPQPAPPKPPRPAPVALPIVALAPPAKKILPFSVPEPASDLVATLPERKEVLLEPEPDPEPNIDWLWYEELPDAEQASERDEIPQQDSEDPETWWGKPALGDTVSTSTR